MRPAGLLRCVLVGALVLVAAMISATPARAALVCTFTITNINFGSIDLTANTNFDTTGTLSINCTGGNSNSTARICPNFGNGTGGSASGDPRFLLSGSTQLNYNLYSDSARTTVWGSVLDSFGSSPPTVDISLNGSGNGSGSRTIFARVASGQQTKSPGTYTSAFSGTHTQIAYARSNVGNCTAIGTRNATSVPFTVTTTYGAVCQVSATVQNFGNSGVLSTAINGSSTLTTTCSATTPYAIALDGGTTGATDPTQRKMSKGAERITYGLYRDTGRTQAWGSTAGVNTQGGTGSGLGQAYTVFGKVPAQATPSPGTYTDTIVATITY